MYICVHILLLIYVDSIELMPSTPNNCIDDGLEDLIQKIKSSENGKAKNPKFRK